MNAFATAAIVFGSLFGATLLSMRLRAALPEHHLTAEAKDAVKVGMGFVATMAALVLGLLVAATKSAYDTERNEVIQMAAKIDYLDHVLANYGPGAKESRDVLRGGVERALIRMWPDEKSQHAQLDPSLSWTDALPNAIHRLSPENDVQRSLKSQAVQLANDLAQMRWLLYEQAESAISMPLLVVVVVWLVIMFTSVGLFAPPNFTVIVALMLAALSVSGAIFLILELDMPFDGILRISSEPMRNALEHVGH
jgi:hypothetical protein